MPASCPDARLVIVSGCPGSGKTTLAAALARSRENGLHLRADVFHAFPAHPIEPTEPASQQQNETIVRALGRASAAFLEGGYAVVLDGIVGPWFLDTLRAELPVGTAVDYVVLRVPLATALERVRARRDESPTARVAPTVRAFADLGDLEHHVVPTADLAPDALRVRVESALAAGRHRLPDRRAGASRPPGA